MFLLSKKTFNDSLNNYSTYELRVINIITVN
ncbi:MAG: hypothetical protein FD155_3348 [Bacteroidetes bacterium]|nr:MAG: hypothetical protein FD155_3348 [Bacteroidota bacterium]